MKGLDKMSFEDLLSWRQWVNEKSKQAKPGSQLEKYWGKAFIKIEDEITDREKFLFGDPYN